MSPIRSAASLETAASLEPDLKGKLAKGAANLAAAKLVGETVAERALAKGIKKVVFDRGGYVYHGKVKELAEAARGFLPPGDPAVAVVERASAPEAFGPGAWPPDPLERRAH